MSEYVYAYVHVYLYLCGQCCKFALYFSFVLAPWWTMLFKFFGFSKWTRKKKKKRRDVQAHVNVWILVCLCRLVDHCG